MNAHQQFSALNGQAVSRSEIETILETAKQENNVAVIYRLSKVLNENPDVQSFEISITQYPQTQGLAGARHTGDYKEALDECGRLKKGWKFVGGNVVKVEKKEKTPKKETRRTGDKELDNIYEEYSKKNSKGFDLLMEDTAKKFKIHKSQAFAIYSLRWSFNKDGKGGIVVSDADLFFKVFGKEYNRFVISHREEKGGLIINKTALWSEIIEFIQKRQNWKKYTQKTETTKQKPQKSGLGLPLTAEIRKKAFTDKGKLRKGWYYEENGLLTNGKDFYLSDNKKEREYKVIAEKLIQTEANYRGVRFQAEDLAQAKEIENNKIRNIQWKTFYEEVTKYLQKEFPSITKEDVWDIHNTTVTKDNVIYFNFSAEDRKIKAVKDFLAEFSTKEGGKYKFNKKALLINERISEFIKKQNDKLLGNTEKIRKKYGLSAPQLSLTTEDFKKMSVPELRAFTLQYYLTHLKGKKVALKNFIKEVVFTTKAGRKIAHGEAMYKEKAVVIEHLEELIKNSTYNNWGDRKANDHEEILGYLNFKSKLTIDGEKRHIRISFIFNKDRELKLKSYDVGKKKNSHASKGVLPSAEEAQLFDRKITKKSETTKQKNKNLGLSAPFSLSAPLRSEACSKRNLATKMASRPTEWEFFQIDNPQMANFLGKVEKKNKDSVVITLTGGQGSGKTRFAFQFINDLAKKYRVGHISNEEQPDSSLYYDKVQQYLNENVLQNIEPYDVRNLSELDEAIQRNEIIVIDSFQKIKEIDPKFEVDKDLRKKYNGKLFLVIFQQTSDGKMRGGSKSQFDGDIILFTEKFDDYRENFVYPDKNRYNSIPANELKYSIFQQRLLPTENQVQPIENQTEELTFDVVA